jgi:hypothetical protein
MWPHDIYIQFSTDSNNKLLQLTAWNVVYTYIKTSLYSLYIAYLKIKNYKYGNCKKFWDHVWKSSNNENLY